MRTLFTGILGGAAAAVLALVPIGAADALSTDAQAGQVVHVTSPSGNIDCYLSADKTVGRFANCLVQKDNWKKHKPRPAACELDWEPAEVTLSRQGKVTVGGCRGDVGSRCLPSGGPESCSTLAYGESVRAGNIRCTSSRKGITCRTTDGERPGFRASRAGVTRL